MVEKYIAERIRTPYGISAIVPESTPVVCFGNFPTAKVLTIGINPSSNEFQKILEGSRVLLSEKERRLADLKYLGAFSTPDLTDFQVEEVWNACISYFKGPYYKKWFDLMETFVNIPLGASYFDGSSCHLDLIQWATDPIWGGLFPERADEAAQLLVDDLPFLLKQIQESSAEIIFLSGKTVIESLGEIFEFENLGKTAAQGKHAQYSLYKGNAGNKMLFGTTMNIASTRTSNAHRLYLQEWLASQIK